MVEAQPQLPVLPAEQGAVQREADPVGLADLQRRHLAQPHRQQVGQVLAHHLRVGAALVVVLDLEQFHRVQVDDGVQPGRWWAYGLPELAAPVPQVAPADPPPRVALGDERRAVGPHVGQHPGQVGDAAPGQRLDDGRVGAEHHVALVPLVDGHVGLLPGQVLPGGDRVPGQRHGGRGTPGRRRGSSTRPAPPAGSAHRTRAPASPPWTAPSARSRRIASPRRPRVRGGRSRRPGGSHRRSAGPVDGAR